VALYLRLVLRNELLELLDFLRKCKCVSGESTMLRLEIGLAKCRSKGLIDLVIGQMFSLASKISFFGGHRKRRESLGRLPWTQIDEGFLIADNTAAFPLLVQKRKVCHGVARSPGERHAQDEQHKQHNNGDKSGLVENSRVAVAIGDGSNWGHCHKWVRCVVMGKLLQRSINRLKVFYRVRPAGLRSAWGEAENGTVRVTIRLAALTLALLGICGAVAAQDQDRDSRGVPRTSTKAPPPEARIDINHATVNELLKIPGVTPSWAGRIVRFRPYRTKLELLDRGVVSESVYDRMKDYVIAHRDSH